MSAIKISKESLAKFSHDRYVVGSNTDCENCKHWKCMGYHYYECTNERSKHCGESKSRGDNCTEFEEE